jgi:hypothetical protein
MDTLDYRVLAYERAEQFISDNPSFNPEYIALIKEAFTCGYIQRENDRLREENGIKATVPELQ